MGRSREDRVYRVRQLPSYLENRGNIAPFLARIAPMLGAADNIHVFSLAQEKSSKTATITFKSLPSLFDNDEQQWILHAEDVCQQNIIVDAHFRDFTILNEPRHSSHTTDCVAISGLASHPFSSWKHQELGSSFMWLRDRLPRDVPQLRSLIYGYDTKIFKSHSFQDLDDIARSFIASLKEIRRTSGSTNSLLFLAHSLGGIVLKRALVLLVRDSNDEERKLFESVKGLVFFGVPHKGMEISHFLAMAAKQPNEDLINRALSPDSTLLSELDAEFSRIALNISKNIRFVYETAESQLTEASLSPSSSEQLLNSAQQISDGTWVRSEATYAVLVNKSSAVPTGTLPRHAIAVNEDHSNMVKFGEDDPICQQITSFLCSLCRSTKSQISDHYPSNYTAAPQSSPLIIPNLDKVVNSTSLDSAQKRVRELSTIPFSQDPSFIGREDILAQLESDFADPKSQNWASLYGLGGIGKSQIAIECSYRRKKQSPHISTFWVHASSKARFEQSFAQMATTVGILESGDSKVDILRVVSDWLTNQDNGPWFLILDNADDSTVLLDPIINDNKTGAMPVQRCLVDFLPRVQHGAVLITTRDRGCALSLSGYRGAPIEVLSMALDESIKLLRIWLPKADQQEASELVQELENMPLAISQAGAYIKEVPRVPIPKYLSIFRRSNADQVALLNKNKRDLWRDSGVPNAVITSWELSFRQIRERFSGSADLMSLMACLNRQAIPTILIMENADDISFEEKINVLVSFSLIRAEIGNDTFVMHKLVQAAMQHWLYSEGCDQLWKNRAIQRVAEHFPTTGHPRDQWPLCEDLMSHADEVIRYTANSSESELHRASVLAGTARYLHARKGHSVLAEQRLADALRIQRRYLEDNSYTILNTLTYLAETQSANLKFEEARGLKEFILLQRLKISGPEHSATFQALHDLASTHFDCGNHETAMDLLKRVIDVGKDLLGSESPIILSSATLLAAVFIGMGKYEEAEKLSTKVLKTCTRLHGPEDIDTITVLFTLSHTLLDQQKLEEAHDLIIQVVPFFTRILGPSHQKTLQARRCLAEIFYRQGRLDEAETICLSCLDVAKEVHGSRLETAWDVNNVLSLLCHAQGKFAEAFNLSKDVLESSTQALGANHPRTLVYTHNLALRHYNVGDKDSAIRLMTDVVEKRREVLRADHPHTIESAECLACWSNEAEESKVEEEEKEDSEEGGIELGEIH